MAGYGRVGRRAQTDEPASERRHPPGMRMRARALLPLSRSPERPWTVRVAREYNILLASARAVRAVDTCVASEQSVTVWGAFRQRPTVSDREAIMRQS